MNEGTWGLDDPPPKLDDKTDHPCNEDTGSDNTDEPGNSDGKRGLVEAEGYSGIIPEDGNIEPHDQIGNNFPTI